MKRDMFSAKTLMAIHEGMEELARVRATPGNTIAITNLHKTLFERLQRSFNNPTLLKEVGVIYLEEFRMPGVALKHFDLARQFAPKDRDIEQLQKSATLAMARQMSDQPSHSGLSEAVHSKPVVSAVMKKTVRINIGETRRHLDEAKDELGRKQQAWRDSGAVKKKSMQLLADFAKPLEQAAKLIAQTDFLGAFAALEEAQKNGAPVEELLAYYAQLGLAAFDNERMAEALSAFLLTRDLAPEAVEGWFNCGLVYQRVGQMDDAMTCYREAARLGPDNAKTWCNLSSVWFEMGNYDEAEKAAHQAIQLKTDYARAWDNLASTLSAMNRLPEAAEACQQAIRFQPALHSAWFKYGVVNFQLDNLVMAMEAFNMTGDNPDFFPYVLYYLCMIEARRGEIDAALQKLAQARGADPENDLESSALKELGAAFTKIGRYATAADFYSQITAKHPDDFSAWLAEGTAYHRAEQIERARAAYQRAIELQPDKAVPWHNLGLLASDQGKLEEARDCFQREVELAPDDAKAWYDFGVSLQALGQEVESAEAMERAEKLVKSASRRSSDLSAALSIVRRLNLGERVLKTE
jgi:tetratricopeptide (TPR) repeat protein